MMQSWLPEKQGAAGPLSRRAVLSLAVVTGVAIALAPAAPAMAAGSLSIPHGALAKLATVGTEPSRVLRRYASAFRSTANPRIAFHRDAAGRLKMVAGCTGSENQLQVVDAATGKRELSAVPFPGSAGGAGAVHFEERSKTYLAFGSSRTVKRVTPAGVVTSAYSVSPDATTASYGPGVDSMGRIWNGNYPGGNASRYDPATGETVHGPRLHSGAQYVRDLAVDARDNVYAGTGAQHPSLFTWHTDSPATTTEIPLPGAAATGFVQRVEAHGPLLFVHYSGDDGSTRFRIFDTASQQWRQPSWNWSPAGRRAASLRADGAYAYAVWNTVGVHKLMRIDTRTLATELLCLVPDSARDIHVERAGADTCVNILCGDDATLRYVRVSVSGKKVLQDVRPDFASTTFRLQALTASPYDGRLFFGGYLGDGIGSIDTATGKTWRSATDTGIAQIEGMHFHNAETAYVGSYAGGVLFRFNPKTGTAKHLITLGNAHGQSRPAAWASAGARVVAGTVPGYGLNGGALAIVNPANDADIKVVRAPVPGQSVLGLVGEGDIVYGTTGVKGGYGSVDDAKDAHVFAWDVRRHRLLWKRPFAGEKEINSPILVKGVLYVSTNNGVVRLNKVSGGAVATYKLLDRIAKPGYSTSTMVHLPKWNSIVHLCGGTATVLDLVNRTQKRILSGSYSDMAITPSGRLYLVEGATSVVELDATQRPTIRSSADLATVGTNGWLYVSRSLGGGKFAEPLRADDGFGGYVRSANVFDWNGDGARDVVTTHSDGTLRLHRGLANGGFAPGKTISTGDWNDSKVAIGVWGATPTVFSLNRKTGILRSRPILSNGTLGAAKLLATGWLKRDIVLMKPSRSSANALIVRQGSALYRYSRVIGGGIAKTGVKLGTGFLSSVAMTPLHGHKAGLNGVVWIDAYGRAKYKDVAVSSLGTSTSYAFLLKSHKLASN